MPIRYNPQIPTLARKLPPPPGIAGKPPAEQARLIAAYLQSIYDAHSGVTGKVDANTSAITAAEPLVDPSTVLVAAPSNASIGTQANGYMHADAQLVVDVGAPATLGGGSAIGSTQKASDAGHIHAITGYPSAQGEVVIHDGATPVAQALVGNGFPLFVDARKSTFLSDATQDPNGMPFKGVWYVSSIISNGVAFPLFDYQKSFAMDVMQVGMRYGVGYDDGANQQAEVGYVDFVATYQGAAWSAGVVGKHDSIQDLRASALTVVFTLDPGHDVTGAVDATKITVKATITSTLVNPLNLTFLNFRFYDINSVAPITFATMP